MKAARRQLVKRCVELGCMLLDDGDCLRIDPPAGKVICDTGGHSRDLYYGGGRWPKPDAYAELLSDLAGGLDDCDDPDCDSCVHERHTFEELQELYRGERLA